MTVPKKETYQPIAAPDWAGQIRAATLASGKSQYRLAKETGVSQGRISTFLAGGDLSLANASALATAVGLKLAGDSRRGKK